MESCNKTDYALHEAALFSVPRSLENPIRTNETSISGFLNLLTASRDANIKRFVDKLVRVALLNGDEEWIYIHVEVQGTKQAEFAKQMFFYNYRIYDRYDRSVASLAVLADEHEHWKSTLPCWAANIP